MGWVAPVVMIAGAVMQAGGQYRAGAAGEKAAKYNAQMARYESKYATEKAEFDVKEHRKDVARFIGEQVVYAGKSGSTGAGSDITPFLETAKQAEIDAALIRYGGAIDSWRMKSQASLLKAGGAELATAGMLQAGGTILNTVGRWDWKRSYGQQRTGGSPATSGNYRWAPRTASGL